MKLFLNVIIRINQRNIIDSVVYTARHYFTYLRLSNNHRRLRITVIQWFLLYARFAYLLVLNSFKFKLHNNLLAFCRFTRLSIVQFEWPMKITPCYFICLNVITQIGLYATGRNYRCYVWWISRPYYYNIYSRARSIFVSFFILIYLCEWLRLKWSYLYNA